MTVYKNRQGTGLYLVFKFIDGELDTGSHSGTYQYKPPTRSYNTTGKAKAQWNRFQKDGYGSRVAEITIDNLGAPHIEYIDHDWTPTIELCKHAARIGNRYHECRRRINHPGIHWSGPEAKKNPDYDPERSIDTPVIRSGKTNIEDVEDPETA